MSTPPDPGGQMTPTSIPETQASTADQVDSWNGACLKYFVARYRRRLQEDHWANEPFNQSFGIPAHPHDARYPLPESVEDDGIMRNLLDDRLFYLAFFCVQNVSSGGMERQELFLWEIFGTSPGRLLELFFKARSHQRLEDRGTSFIQIYLRSVTLVKPTTLESYLDHVESRLRMPNLVPSFKSTLDVLKDGLLQVQQDLIECDLESAWTATHTSKYGLGDYHRYSPLCNGMKQYLQTNEDRLFTSVLKHSLTQLPVFHDLGIHMNDTFNRSFPAQPPTGSGSRHPILVFDTAGTGKTTAIQDDVRKSFGFYCLSPNLLPSDVRDVTSVIAPDRACASRDTYTLYEDFKALGKLDIDSCIWTKFLTPPYISKIHVDSMNIRPIIAARRRLLAIFKRIRGAGMSDAEERQLKWLQLQISCWPGNDPFDAAYRFARLKALEDVDTMIHMDKPAQRELWVFDEAQQALSDPLARVLVSDIIWTWRNVSSNSQCVLSGTSLESEQMLDFLKNDSMMQNLFERQSTMVLDRNQTVSVRKYQNAYVLDEDRFLKVIWAHTWNIVKELYALQKCNNLDRAPKDFPLLSRGGKALGFTVQLPEGTWEEVEMALQKWYVFNILPATLTTTSTNTSSGSTRSTHGETAANMSYPSKKPTDGGTDLRNQSEETSKELTRFVNRVKRAHSVLLGRIRWTALFAEELLRASPAVEGKLTDRDVDNAVERATNLIKRSLRGRIDQFKNAHWVHELYWTAIEADVFSMTRIFSDEQSSKLISEGFALVDEQWKGSIKGPQAGQSGQVVKGSLREPLAVKAVMEYLRDPKHSSLYDKLIDRFFGSLQLDRYDGGALGKLAEFVFTAKLDHFLRNTKDELARSRRAKFIEILKNAEGKLLDTSGAEEEDKRETAKQKIEGLEDYYLVDDAGRFKVEEKTDTYQWFKGRPSNFKFPRQNDGPDLLFFLEKLASTPGPTSKILCAVQFKTGTEHVANKQHIMKALYTLVAKPWKHAKWGWCPIIHIYVANSIDISEFNFKACLAEKWTEAHRTWDRELLRDNDFICYMDRQRSQDVFGETFSTLLRLMKGQSVGGNKPPGSLPA